MACSSRRARTCVQARRDVARVEQLAKPGRVALLEHGIRPPHPSEEVVDRMGTYIYMIYHYYLRAGKDYIWRSF